ncbi:MAG: aldo/keto reductase [Clostridiales bacterium]|jgi:predicted aldo/keto reductase-like oxidoreductase|nr:aldo/keto reductase [Clostridiales bacterium]
MKTRKFGNIFDVSVLGFGAMRMPTAGGAVDEREAVKLIRYAIDSGVNYVDTAFFYHKGESEKIVGRALKDGYRHKTMLATKLPLLGQIRTREDYDKTLDTQLAKLQTDHIDFYLLHGLNKRNWNDTVLKLDLIGKMESAKKAGKVKHFGFSFHDDHETFIKIVDSYDQWEFCQIQYNYIDTENQAGVQGLRYAASKGIPVIVMEPVLGGKIAAVPEKVREIFDSHPIQRSPVEWAFRFVWNHEEVITVLSGMSSMAQLEENLQYAENAQAGLLTEEDLAMLERVKTEYQKLRPVPCTACGYCLPCPNGVNIPENFRVYNDTFSYDMESSKGGYAWIPGGKAESCVSCGECDAKCPQKINISELMPKVHARLK